MPDRISYSCAAVSLCCILLRMRSDSRSFSYTVCEVRDGAAKRAA